MTDVIPIEKTRSRRQSPRETSRARSEPHRRWVASLPCCICGGRDVQAAHLAFAQPRGRGLKASDAFCVPLCLSHHADFDAGHGPEWWAERGIDPLALASRLWVASITAGRFPVVKGKFAPAMITESEINAWIANGYRDAPTR